MIESHIDKPALFLDRDGVINRKIDHSYVRNMDEFEFLDGAIEAIKALNQFFYPVVIVTNQQGIGKRLMTAWDLEILHMKVLLELKSHGATIHQDYFCPHLAEVKCLCRKPETGMFHQAQIEFPFIRKEHAWMVGDSDSDILAARNFGIRSARIAKQDDPVADLTIASLKEFSDLVLENPERFK